MLDETATPLFVDDECEPLCESVDILRKMISIETGEETLVIKVSSRDNGIPFAVSREQFVKQSFFNKLTLHGLSIIECDKSYAQLRAHINEAERHAPVTYSHESIGFRVLHGKPCFLGYRPIGDIPPPLLASRNHKMEAMLKPQGDFSEWKYFVRTNIVPNTERSLALILGTTAPVSYILKAMGEFVDVAVWGLVNSTSKGKSSLLYLVASLYANPRSFIDTFNATNNALYAMLEERGAYPFLCDEATHTPNLDWDSMLYTLPTGKERRRCDSKGKLKPMVEFGGAIIMTSEVSILDRSKRHGGEECRIIEFELDPFKGEPDMAEQVRKFCFSNYGWATEPLMTLLLDPIEKAKLVKQYSHYFERLKKRVKFDVTGVERRLLQRCALILASGWILRKAVQCNFDLHAIEEYLVAHLSQKISVRDDRDEADKILDKITGFVCANRDKFPTAASLMPRADHKHYGAFWGATGFYGTKACLWIQENVLNERILTEEMQNRTTTLQALHKKGYVVKFYDRRYCLKKEFGGVNAQYYCFLLPDSPSLIKNVEDISDAKLSVATLSAKLAEDYYIKNYENLNAERNMLYLAISRGANNSYAVFASTAFLKAMAMSSHSTIYATYLADEKALLLTKNKVTINSIALVFDKKGDGGVAKGISVLNFVDKISINIPIGHRLVMTEVSVEEYAGKPGAVVNMQNHLLCIEPVDTPPVDFTVKTFTDDGVRYRHVASLLSDEDDNKT